MHEQDREALAEITVAAQTSQSLSNAERTHYLALCEHLGQQPVTPTWITQSALAPLIVVHALPVTTTVPVVDETASSRAEAPDSGSDEHTYYSPTDACLVLTEPSGWLRQRYTNATTAVLRYQARAFTPAWRQTVTQYTALTREHWDWARAPRRRLRADPPLPQHAAAAAQLEADIFAFLARRRATRLAVLFDNARRRAKELTAPRRRAAELAVLFDNARRRATEPAAPAEHKYNAGAPKA